MVYHLVFVSNTVILILIYVFINQEYQDARASCWVKAFILPWALGCCTEACVIVSRAVLADRRRATDGPPDGMMPSVCLLVPLLAPGYPRKVGQSFSDGLIFRK